MLDEAAREVPPEDLSAHFDDSYGIFSGPAEHTAELRFTPEMARWVSEEMWHPDQQGAFEADGSWLLKVPFSSARELIMDVLRYGAEVEVLAPGFPARGRCRRGRQNRRDLLDRSGSRRGDAAPAALHGSYRTRCLEPLLMV